VKNRAIIRGTTRQSSMRLSGERLKNDGLEKSMRMFRFSRKIPTGKKGAFRISTTLPSRRRKNVEPHKQPGKILFDHMKYLPLRQIDSTIRKPFCNGKIFNNIQSQIAIEKYQFNCTKNSIRTQ
jgi:hypothetical protein